MSMSSEVFSEPPPPPASGAAGRTELDEDWEMPPPAEERTEEELANDLSKVEEEIRTLRQVLGAKEQRANEIRRKLGITPLQLMGKDVANSFNVLRETSGVAASKLANSETMQKLKQSHAVEASKTAVSSAAEKTKTGITNLGTSIGSGMRYSLDSIRTSVYGSGGDSGTANQSFPSADAAAEDPNYVTSNTPSSAPSL